MQGVLIQVISSAGLQLFDFLTRQQKILVQRPSLFWVNDSGQLELVNPSIEDSSDIESLDTESSDSERPTTTRKDGT